jgi:hypothetical protein
MARYEQFSCSALTVGNGRGLAGQPGDARSSSVVLVTGVNLGTLTANTVTAVTGITVPGVDVNDVVLCMNVDATTNTSQTVGVVSTTVTAANTITVKVIGAAGTYSSAKLTLLVLKTQ